MTNPDPDVVAEFRTLHEKARRGVLSRAERHEYHAVRERLSSLLCAGQRVTLLAGQRARTSFRLSTVWPLILEFDGKAEKTNTMDLSFGGFSAVIDRAIAVSSIVPFRMKLPSEPIEGLARVVGGRALLEHFRASFAFASIEPNARELLDFAIADAVLAHLG